ncbi:MAG TPA: proline dehydrogenase family protein [Methylomirabilota bacterium]|nr:proline dehydrogenase family protein [Methylomirabilota bacterium]
MMRAALLALSARPGLGRALDRLPLTRRLVRRFVAGTELEDALIVIQRMNDGGLSTAVTYLGENVATEAAARAAGAAYLEILDQIKRRSLRCVPSLKLTHMGLDVSEGACAENLRRILDRARDHGTLVWIDMEQTVYTDRTLRLYAELRREYPNVACVIQAYLRRSEEDVRRLIGLGATVRLCKGAYREPPSLAFADRAEVERNYERLMDLLLAAGTYTGFATHDERLIARVERRARELGTPRERFEIQMLYGIRGDLHGQIRAMGLALRLLVPYGEEWYGYFMRRLAERPANLLFLLKNLAR